ncbi:hypothetical protein GCM10007301_00830 [Azorhizobium oxalatiphilum]|uniref:Uncharacterized protein n=1 Tax=Azorhizobium oxalatiphilum TaxID=980631 RepID=A0A917F3E9_9HYPH|nr:hypothetical protein GCM10007301_00830 [Azorhizobium oxalatiphilum]
MAARLRAMRLRRGRESRGMTASIGAVRTAMRAGDGARLGWARAAGCDFGHRAGGVTLATAPAIRRNKWAVAAKLPSRQDAAAARGAAVRGGIETRV